VFFVAIPNNRQKIFQNLARFFPEIAISIRGGPRSARSTTMSTNFNHTSHAKEALKFNHLPAKQ
jgi:hypothetical protein